MRSARWCFIGVLGVAACGAEVRPAAKTRSSLGEDAGLPRSAVDTVIEAHLDSVRACYERFAKGEGRPMGVVRAGWRVEPSGVVTDVTIIATTLHSSAIEHCIVDDVGRWRFPAASRPTEVAEHPFTF